MKKYMNKGISMITLVITIIVVIIITGVVVITLQKNNPIKSAQKAKFVQNVDTYKSELENYKQVQLIKEKGKFDYNSLESNSSYLKQDGLIVDNENIYDVIPSLKGLEYKEDEFIVSNGKLVYRGKSKDEQDWSKDTGIIVATGNIEINFVLQNMVAVKAKYPIQYNIVINSDVPIKDINLDTLKTQLYITDDKDDNIENQPSIVLSNIEKKDGYNEQITATITTGSLTDGQYSMKIIPNAIQNIANTYNTETKAKDLFTIDNMAPEQPKILLSTSFWTNQNITVKIKYPGDSVSNEYSFDDINWENYSNDIVIDKNCIIYARATDEAGNYNISTMSISIIDKQKPTYSNYLITNVDSTGYDVYIYGVSDIGISGINRVQIVSWSTLNGQDDLVSDWSTNSALKGIDKGNGTWYYRVQRHQKDYGQYYTNIYIYDNANNVTEINTQGAILKSVAPENLNLTINNSGILNITWDIAQPELIKQYNLTVAGKSYTITNKTSYSLAAPNEGNVNVTVSSTDNDGNISPVTSEVWNLVKTVTTIPLYNESYNHVNDYVHGNSATRGSYVKTINDSYYKSKSDKDASNPYKTYVYYESGSGSGANGGVVITESDTEYRSVDTSCSPDDSGLYYKNSESTNWENDSSSQVYLIHKWNSSWASDYSSGSSHTEDYTSSSPVTESDNEGSNYSYGYSCESHVSVNVSWSANRVQ